MHNVKLNDWNVVPRDVMLYCEKYISPRKYYLHNKIGGTDWMLFNDGTDWYFSTNDLKHLTFFILQQ
jgi:hypothetical protein